ncbi:MAG: phosphatase PAP2 family protein [bacterium]|nr:phosphatase PAP2 family protein [bacterium]
MYFFDEFIFHFINNLAGRWAVLDSVVIWSNRWGIIAFSLVLVCYFFKNSKIFWAVGLSALLSRGIFKELINFLLPRPRPFLVYEHVHILTVQTNLIDGLASPTFPSGHASYLFAIAFAIFFINRKFGWLLLVSAAFLSMARIYLGVHYPSDIIAGAIIAWISAFSLRKLVFTK